MRDKQKTAAFSGHRSFKTGGGLFAQSPEQMRLRLLEILRALAKEGYTHFLCGMAEGFDIMAGEAVVALQKEGAPLELVAVVPFPEQARGFSPELKARYDTLLAVAREVIIIKQHYSVDCFHARNDFLVANSSVLVCYYNGSGGGTQYTVRRAITAKSRILQL